MLFLADIRVVRAYLAVGLVAVVTYHWTSRSPYAYELVGSYAVVGAVIGVLRQESSERRPWLVLTGGLVLMVAGDLARDLSARPGSPNVSDAFYMVAYPLLAVGLLLLTRQITSPGNVLDTLIVAGSMSALLWPLLFASLLHGGQTLAQRLTLGIYPCWDLFLLAAVARIALSRSMHMRRAMLLVAAVALFLLGDIFRFDSINTYALGNWQDYVWLTAYVCWGAAALHPVATRDAEHPDAAPVRRVALLAVPVVFLPATILIGMTRNDSSEYVAAP